ncbi:hypothetical protein PA3071 [hydrothermal vent metagenome]|uniref:DUF58 domain-containing protein n=1 Tax=hydrothermal vent metagenome TaxID=652676 RepID=A0A1W1CD51_9ZZZZ
MNGVNLTISELLNKEKNLQSELKSNVKIRAPLSGHKHSSIKGRGIDFSEVREYQFGDDIRSIDWKVSARTNKTHTKIYQEEKERPIMLCVDLGFSMRFASTKAFKSVIASHFSSLIAWASFHHKDRVGAIIFNGKSHLECRPKGGKQGVQSIIKSLVQLHEKKNTAPNKNDLDNALLRLKKVIHPGTMIVIVSDFQNFSENTRSLCRQLMKHNDIIFTFVYDELEKNAPKSNHYLISNGEKTTTLNTTQKSLKIEYEQLFKKRFDNIKQFSKQLKTTFIPIKTNDNLVDKINKHLSILIR